MRWQNILPSKNISVCNRATTTNYQYNTRTAWYVLVPNVLCTFFASFFGAFDERGLASDPARFCQSIDQSINQSTNQSTNQHKPSINQSIKINQSTNQSEKTNRSINKQRCPANTRIPYPPPHKARDWKPGTTMDKRDEQPTRREDNNTIKKTRSSRREKIKENEEKRGGNQRKAEQQKERHKQRHPSYVVKSRHQKEKKTVTVYSRLTARLEDNQSHVGQTDQIDHDRDHLDPNPPFLRCCAGPVPVSYTHLTLPTICSV